MGVNNKSFTGLDSHVKSRVARLNKEIGYARAINNSNIKNWQTQHKGYGEPLKEENGRSDDTTRLPETTGRSNRRTDR